MSVLTERYWKISEKISLLEAELFDLKKELKIVQKELVLERGKLQFAFDFAEKTNEQ